MQHTVSALADAQSQFKRMGLGRMLRGASEADEEVRGGTEHDGRHKRVAWIGSVRRFCCRGERCRAARRAGGTRSCRSCAATAGYASIERVGSFGTAATADDDSASAACGCGFVWGGVAMETIVRRGDDRYTDYYESD